MYIYRLDEKCIDEVEILRYKLVPNTLMKKYGFQGIGVTENAIKYCPFNFEEPIFIIGNFIAMMKNGCYIHFA